MAFRWHEGSTKNTNSNGVHDDSARLRCHTCNVNRELYWDRDSKQFQIRAPGKFFCCLLTGIDNFNITDKLNRVSRAVFDFHAIIFMIIQKKARDVALTISK